MALRYAFCIGVGRGGGVYEHLCHVTPSQNVLLDMLAGRLAGGTTPLIPLP